MSLTGAGVLLVYKNECVKVNNDQRTPLERGQAILCSLLCIRTAEMSLTGAGVLLICKNEALKVINNARTLMDPGQAILNGRLHGHLLAETLMTGACVLLIYKNEG